MIFTKKNMALVIAMVQIVFSSCAMNKSLSAQATLKQLYDKLVTIASGQRNVFPFKQESAITQKSGEVGRDAQRSVFQQTIFNTVKKNDLKAKYNELLAGSPDSLQWCCGPLQLVVAAYMQNTYGNGDPLKYRERLDLSFDEYKPYNYPILGVFNKTKITRYNFVYSLISEADKIDALIKDPAVKLSKEFGEKLKNIEMIRANLIKAIDYVTISTMPQEQPKREIGRGLLSGSGG